MSRARISLGYKTDHYKLLAGLHPVGNALPDWPVSLKVFGRKTRRLPTFEVSCSGLSVLY